MLVSRAKRLMLPAILAVTSATPAAIAAPIRPSPTRTTRDLQLVRELSMERAQAQQTLAGLRDQLSSALPRLAQQRARLAETGLQMSRSSRALAAAEGDEQRVLAPTAALAQQPPSAALLASQNPQAAPLIYEETRALLADRSRALAAAHRNAKRLSAAEGQQRRELATVAKQVATIEQDRQASRLLARRLTVSMRAPLVRLRSNRAALAQLIEALARPGTVPAASVPTSIAGMLPAARIVATARSELARNVREEPEGSNLSPAILRYETATAGALPGAPWCAYFVSYVAWKAGVPVGPEGQGEGYVPALRAWAEATGRWVPVNASGQGPLPGDLFLLPEHTGIVVEVHGETLTTIEGNYANRVAEVHRPINEVEGFVQLAGTTSSTVRASAGESVPAE